MSGEAICDCGGKTGVTVPDPGVIGVVCELLDEEREVWLEGGPMGRFRFLVKSVGGLTAEIESKHSYGSIMHFFSSLFSFQKEENTILNSMNLLVSLHHYVHI